MIVRKRLKKNQLVLYRKRLKKNRIDWDKVKNYAYSYAKLWIKKGTPLEHGYEYNDLVQEAYLVFVKALQKYRGDSKYSSHFFTYFTVSLENHFTSKFTCWYDKGRKDKIGNASEINNDILGGGHKEFLYPLAIRFKSEIPELVFKALDFMFNAPEEKLEELGFRKKGSHGFKNNLKFCRVLGIEDPNKLDIMEEIRKYIISAD